MKVDIVKIKKLLKSLVPVAMILLVLNSGYFITDVVTHIIFNVSLIIIVIVLTIIQITKDKEKFAKSIKELSIGFKILLICAILIGITVAVVLSIMLYSQ